MVRFSSLRETSLCETQVGESYTRQRKLEGARLFTKADAKDLPSFSARNHPVIQDLEGRRQQPSRSDSTKKTDSGKAGMGGDSASGLIDARLNETNDWRGKILARVRRLIKQADPDVVEEVKWRKPSAPAGVPVWSHGGIICTGEMYKDKVKLTFAKGASLADPAGVFNASLEGNARRAIDFYEGDKIDAKAFQALIRAAVALNTSAAKLRSSGRK